MAQGFRVDTPNSVIHTAAAPVMVGAYSAPLVFVCPLGSRVVPFCPFQFGVSLF